MKHPFEINHLSESDIEQVTGAAGPQSARNATPPKSVFEPGPLPPPVYITFALGEDGGEYPYDDFI